MRVSVIIRTFNRAHIVGDAIASVLAQTLSDIEVIVVDDGSTDDTTDVVNAFGSDRIRLLRHEHNRGVSAAGNTGIAASRGDIIAHLDSDDLWHPEMLATLVDFLDRHLEADAVFCGVDVDRGRQAQPDSTRGAEGGAFEALLARHQDPDEVVFGEREMYLLLLETVPMNPINSLIRRSAFERLGGYDESWRSGEDWEFYLRLTRRSRIGFINKILATVRVQPDSTLALRQVEDKTSLISWERREKRANPGDIEAQAALNRALAHHYDILGHTYLSAGAKFKAIATYAQGAIETRRLGLGLRTFTSLLPTVAIDALRRLKALGRRGRAAPAR